MRNEIVWGGYVEVFDLTSHETAKRCYAWQDISKEGIKIFTVPESQLIYSAQRAVQAAIFVDALSAVAQPADDLDLLKKRIESARKALYEADIRNEDLDAIIQTSVSIQKEGMQKRIPPA